MEYLCSPITIRGLGLDRFLVSSKWETHYLGVCEKRLSCLCSDHFPVLLNCGGIQGGVSTLNLKICD